MSTRRAWTALTILAIVAGLAGCSGTEPTDAGSQSPTDRAPLAAAGTAIPELVTALGGSYECRGVSIPVEAWEARRPLSDLSEVRQTVLEQAMLEPEGISEAGEWYVVEDSPGILTVMRATDQVDVVPDDVWFTGDHEVLRITASEGLANLEQGWIPSGWTTCPVTVQMGGLDSVSVQLDAANPPDPIDRELHLLVLEAGCHEAEAVAGAIEIMQVAEDADTVAVALGVTPFTGPQPACLGGPWVPITIELDHPLGDRKIVDGSRMGAPELAVR